MPTVTAIALIGKNNILPAVTPTPTPAFSMASSVLATEGNRQVNARASAAERGLVRLTIELSSQEKPGANRFDAVRWVPVASHAEVITAGIVVEIVVEAAELSVLKAHSRETGAAGDR